MPRYPEYSRRRPFLRRQADTVNPSTPQPIDMEKGEEGLNTLEQTGQNATPDQIKQDTEELNPMPEPLPIQDPEQPEPVVPPDPLDTLEDTTKTSRVNPLEWEFNSESDTYMIAESRISSSFPRVGFYRGEDGQLWNVWKIHSQNFTGYHARVVPERNTVLAGKKETSSSFPPKTPLEPTPEFLKGWKFASLDNEPPRFRCTEEFLEGYIACVESERRREESDDS